MRKQRRQRGFTLIELLATVAITVVFLAISILAVGSYRSRLKITELDNEARQIYLAAQNRAVLLRSRGALEPLLKDGGMSLTAARAGDSAKLFYITNAEPDKAEALDQLLPVGTIDPSLREGQFYIVYEPESGSVTDAFYMEEGSLEDAFSVYYATHPISAEDRRQHDPMVGWYGGDAAEAGDVSYLETPEIEIINEDTLRAEIIWSVPNDVREPNKCSLKVIVSYGDRNVDISTSRSISTAPEGAGGTSRKSVYLLDSLVDGMQFMDLFEGVPLGGDFAIRAEIEYTGADAASYIPRASEKTANSLFADSTDGATAHIAYLRHLQNLDPTFSGVDSAITMAVQDKDIDKPSEKTGYILAGAKNYSPDPNKPYNFKPINNTNLTSYDGRTKEIRWLHSTGSEDAGLFSSFSGSLKDIRLMNADISGTGSVGALCGNAGTVTVEGCQVYWKAEKTGAVDQLGEADGKTYALSDYKITGGTVGGLIGSANGVTINNSFASTTVSGATVGGLVGRGEDQLTITNSYADCYLKGSSAAAGLVGLLQGNGNSFTNVYTAGFVSMDGGSRAAGLYLDGGATVHKSYAAMAYSATDNVYPLSSNRSDSDVYYLSGFGTADGGTSFSSAEELQSLLSAGFAAVTNTYAYNLRSGVTLGNYPYPGLAGLDHYGDWLQAVPKDQGCKLVYWEKYKDDDTVGIWGSTLGRMLREDDDALVEADGYAILLEDSEFTNGEITIDYWLNGYVRVYPNNEYYVEGFNGFVYKKEDLRSRVIDGKKYYLAEVPKKCLDEEPKYQGNLLQMVRVTIGDTGTQTCWYDPYFAKEPIGGTAAPTDPGAAYVRSPRHLYKLSRFANNSIYGSDDNKKGRTFEQELNIDYTVYDKDYVKRTGIDFGDPTPVSYFQDICTYDGKNHHIWNVTLKTDGIYSSIGLFGNSGGTIKNVLFGGTDSKNIEIDGSTQSSVGALVGHNTKNGIIENCAVIYVSLKSNRTDSPVLGGLVGTNNGTIKNCSVDNVTLDSTGSGSNVGGLVGINATDAKSIEYCTVGAAGDVSITSMTGIANVNAGGLVGLNHAAVNGCTVGNTVGSVSITSNSISTINGADDYNNAYVGGLIGQNTASVDNCVVDGVSLKSISTLGNTYVGGLVGLSNNETIDYCIVGHVSLVSSANSASGSGNGNVYIGGLVGHDGSTVENCAVGYVTLKSTGTIRNTYVGGLLGQNNGTITNCSASTDKITADLGYTGGFVGYIEGGKISNSYSISCIDAGAGTAAGFAAKVNNNDLVSNSYAAADVTGGDPQYAFAPGSSTACYYLDRGEYQNEPFIAPKGSGNAESKTWEELTDCDNPLFHDSFSYLDENDESEHRLPAIVKDADGKVFHYGSTVFKTADAPVGVYYWEYEGGSYHFHVVGYDPVSGKYSELINDLCTEHDGRVITGYGYGWFESPETASGTGFTSEGIDHDGADSDWYKSDQITAVGTALSGYPELGGYTFHSFPTAGNDGAGGLCLDGTSASGKWTIGSAVFEINPFFANAINYSVTGGPSGLGTSKPYEIRSVRQLQFINWNAEKHDCSSCVDAGGSASPFPYLGAGLTFRQTHDLDSKAEGSTTPFFPIAALRDTSGSGDLTVSGVFGGAYDGRSYLIKNIDINGTQANTLGLFGATLDAKLANIILYSENGNNTLTIQNDGAGNGWYYAGGLVGLAMQSADGSASITNCATAGLQITDMTRNNGRYGGSIGGLVGATNVPVSKCTAVNDIYIDYRHINADPYGVRVGGLVGASESTITSCYSGGSIKVDPICSADDSIYTSLVSLYIGRISGGIDIKVDTDRPLYSSYNFTKNLDILNSYSYVSLPAQLRSSDGSCQRELYNIAGNAELGPRGYDASGVPTNSVIAVNCYYYDKDYPSGEYVVPHDTDCTYEDQIKKRNYSELSYLYLGSDFGKIYDQNYSHSPISDEWWAYPFPAVLKRGSVFVHYGKFLVEGLTSASSAMTIDLFADYDAATGAAYQDNLVWPTQDLTSHIPGGQFRPELTQVVNAEGDENTEPVCEAAFVDESETYPDPEAGQRILRVTFLRPGDAEVTVYYGQPWADIDDCVALTIPVTDTAELHMQPADTAVPDGGLDSERAAYSFTGGSVTAFTGADTALELYPFDKNNEPIAPELEDKLSVTVTGFGYDGAVLASAVPTVDIVPDITETDAPAAITLDGAAATDGARTMTVDYSYTIEGMDGALTGSDDILYEVKDLTVEPKAIVFVRQGGAFTPGSVVYGMEDIRFTVDGEAAAVEDLRVTNAVSPSGAVAFTLNGDGSVTAAPGGESGSYAMEQTQLDLTFTYGPASHSVCVYPLVCFYEDGMVLHLAGDTMNDDGSIDLYAGAAAGTVSMAGAEPVSVDALDMPEVMDIPVAAAVEPAAFGAEAPVTTPLSPEDNGTAPANMPGAGTPVRVLEHLDDGWSVQWSPDDTLTPWVSVISDGGTAWLAVTGAPETNVTDGLLTVTVTLPEPWLGVTFTGSIPVHIINENAPSPTPAPTAAPEATPLPENTAPPVQEVTPAPPVQEPEWQPEPEPEWQPEFVPDAPDTPDFLPEEEFIPW